MCTEKVLKSLVKINPISHWLSDSVAPKVSLRYPPIYIKEEVISDPMWLKSIFNRYIVVTCKKFGQKSEKLKEISGFQNFEKLIFCFTLMIENSHNFLDFEDIGLIFYMQI